MIRHRDELHLTYPPTIHFKWMVDLVTMSLGVGQMQYLMLAREDLMSQVEGRPLQNKRIAGVCRFLIEEVVCWYGCVGKIVVDRGELDAQEAEELFDRLGVRLSLTTAYNLEANGKVECGHGVEYGLLMAVFTLSISGRAIFVICRNGWCPSLGV
jgi:hypothetical protein